MLNHGNSAASPRCSGCFHSASVLACACVCACVMMQSSIAHASRGLASWTSRLVGRRHAQLLSVCAPAPSRSLDGSSAASWTSDVWGASRTFAKKKSRGGVDNSASADGEVPLRPALCPTALTHKCLHRTRPDRRRALEMALKQVEGQFGKGSIMKLGDECVVCTAHMPHAGDLTRSCARTEYVQMSMSSPQGLSRLTMRSVLEDFPVGTLAWIGMDSGVASLPVRRGCGQSRCGNLRPRGFRQDHTRATRRCPSTEASTWASPPRPVPSLHCASWPPHERRDVAGHELCVCRRGARPRPRLRSRLGREPPRFAPRSTEHRRGSA